MKWRAKMALDMALRFAGAAGYALLYIFGWRFVAFAGGAAATAVYLVNKKLRVSARKQIIAFYSKNFGGEKINYILRHSFKNYYKRQVETIFFGALNKDRINKIVYATGLENLDSALSKGKGVILLLSHFGSFLLPLPFLGFRGYKVNQVTGKQRHASLISERVWVWRKKEADRLPVKFIQVDRFLRPLYEALGRNEVVAIAFDGQDGSSRAPVDFLGKKVRFATGPFELARRTGAVIIPAFTIRNRNNTHRLVLEPAFELSPCSESEAAAIADTENFAKMFAGYVARYPCHFGMVLYKLKP